MKANALTASHVPYLLDNGCAASAVSQGLNLALNVVCVPYCLDYQRWRLPVSAGWCLQGHLAHKKERPPVGPP